MRGFIDNDPSPWIFFYHFIFPHASLPLWECITDKNSLQSMNDLPRKLIV